MYCRKCGREIPDDSVMCGYCGTPTTVSYTHLTLPTTPYV